MTRRLELHPYQPFPAAHSTRSIARTLCAVITDLPIVSLHGHTDPTRLTDDHNSTDATSLPLAPDHYIFRKTTLDAAEVYDTVGLSDDTRAFLSIPAHHDVARRIDCGFPAGRVAEHRIEDWTAADLARDLTDGFVCKAYCL